MEVIIDPKLKQYIELHEKALKKRDAAAMYQLGRLYAQSKKPDSAKGICRSAVYDGIVLRNRCGHQAELSSGD